MWMWVLCLHLHVFTKASLQGSIPVQYNNSIDFSRSIGESVSVLVIKRPGNKEKQEMRTLCDGGVLGLHFSLKHTSDWV